MIRIIDNVLNDSLLISIKKRIEAPESMPWYFIENSASHGSSNILNYSFYHLVLDKENYNNEIALAHCYYNLADIYKHKKESELAIKLLKNILIIYD